MEDIIKSIFQFVDYHSLCRTEHSHLQQIKPDLFKKCDGIAKVCHYHRKRKTILEMFHSQMKHNSSFFFHTWGDITLNDVEDVLSSLPEQNFLLGHTCCKGSGIFIQKKL